MYVSETINFFLTVIFVRFFIGLILHAECVLCNKIDNCNRGFVPKFPSYDPGDLINF